MTPKPWTRKRKKSILKDPVTGQEYTLAEPRYGHKNRKECKGGCRLSGMPRFHDSVEEAFYCNKLMILKRIGEIKDYEPQVTMGLRDFYGDHVGSVRVDFVVTLPDGKQEVHEYKGSLFESLREFRLSRALFTWNHPEIEYKTVTKKDLI